MVGKHHAITLYINRLLGDSGGMSATVGEMSATVDEMSATVGKLNML